ncbi:hypothetical protein C922_04922 [Plasmodium inui San Antonio 1]|uniref:CNNM transmembrane domain-containing protein n=1 Tax=Plasmodium inui San Antonio 1 TaxID=1237626 RepID=W7AHC6_9APIC|nr:hypothetical protein C922_04922 [Plasmodium inui San Antonio 1]EUD64666.1 hypothetical protein C922_04922 [Plasmodium inui San Antonio 1]
MQLWLLITCIVVCGILSGLFSGLSLGIMMLDTLQLNLLILVSEKDKKELNNAKNARKILPLRNNTNEILVTFIAANVMVNSAFSLLLSELTDGITSFIISTVIITIFGEIIPQSICSKHGLAIGGFFAPLIHCLKFCLFIFAKPTSLILDHFVGKNVLTTYNKKQLKALVDMHKSAADILHEDEAKIVVSALELSQYKVMHIMTDIDYVFGIDYNSCINYETIKRILKSGFSRIPVLNRCNSECVVGLIHIKDLINIWFGINKIIFDNNSLVQCRKRRDTTKHKYYKKRSRTGIFHLIKMKSEKIRIANKIYAYDGSKILGRCAGSSKEGQSDKCIDVPHRSSQSSTTWSNQKRKIPAWIHSAGAHLDGEKRKGYDTDTAEDENDWDSTLGKENGAGGADDGEDEAEEEEAQDGVEILDLKGSDDEHLSTDSEMEPPQEASNPDEVKINIDQRPHRRGAKQKKRTDVNRDQGGGSTSNSDTEKKRKKKVQINVEGGKEEQRAGYNNYYEGRSGQAQQQRGERGNPGTRDEPGNSGQRDQIVNPSKLREQKKKKVKKIYKNPYRHKNRNVNFVEFLSDQMMLSGEDEQESCSPPEEVVFTDIQKRIRYYSRMNKGGGTGRGGGRERERRGRDGNGAVTKTLQGKPRSGKSRRMQSGNSGHSIPSGKGAPPSGATTQRGVQNGKTPPSGNTHKANDANDTNDADDPNESGRRGRGSAARSSISDIASNHGRNRYISQSIMLKENLNKEKNMKHIFLDIKNYIRISRNKDIEIPVKYILKHIGRYIYGVDYNESILSLLSFFKSASNHIVVVRKVIYDENADPNYAHIGIITLEDVIEILLQEEITDEFDFRSVKKGTDIPSNFVWKNSDESLSRGGHLDEAVQSESLQGEPSEGDSLPNQSLSSISPLSAPHSAPPSQRARPTRKHILMPNCKRELISFLKESVYFKYIDTQLIRKCIQRKKIKTTQKNEYLLKENTFLNYAIILMKGRVRNIKNGSSNVQEDKCIIALEALGPCNIIELFNSSDSKKDSLRPNWPSLCRDRSDHRRMEHGGMGSTMGSGLPSHPSSGLHSGLTKTNSHVIHKNINILFKKWYTQHVYYNKSACIAETPCEYIILSKNEYMDMIIECYSNNKVDEIIEDN